MSLRHPIISVRLRSRMRRAFTLGVLIALVAVAASCFTHSSPAGHSHAGAPTPLVLPSAAEATTGHPPVTPSPSCPPDSRSHRTKPSEQAPPVAPGARTVEAHPSPADGTAVRDSCGSRPTAHGARTGRLTLLRISRWRI